MPYNDTNKFPDNLIQFINEMQTIQELILKFIDNDTMNIEENYQNLINMCNAIKLTESKNKFIEFILIIKNIAFYHFRTEHFYEKIEQILNYYKDYIPKYLDEFDLLTIFEDNPRMMLYLITNEIIVFDINVFNCCLFLKYDELYFIKEIKSFCESNKIKFPIIFENRLKQVKRDKYFDLNRQYGENENHICQIIRRISKLY